MNPARRAAASGETGGDNQNPDQEVLTAVSTGSVNWRRTIDRPEAGERLGRWGLEIAMAAVRAGAKHAGFEGVA